MTDTVQRLQACLDQEIILVDVFMQLLQEESDALLNGGDIATLNASTTKKNSHADQISAWDDQRQALLTELGYSTDKAGLDAAAVAHPTLRATCETLYHKADKANQMNASNGHIIATLMAHNQEAIDTLKRLADPGQVYDASGRARPGKNQPKTNIKAG